jgi:hypothetical protein
MNRFLEIISATIILTIGVSGCQATAALHPTETSQPIVQPTIALNSSPTAIADILSTLTPKVAQEITNPSPTPFYLKPNFPKHARMSIMRNTLKSRLMAIG